MARSIKGDVVVMPFPFSDLTQAKKRPALVLVELQGDDVILCQITSQPVKDEYAVPLEDSNFGVGGLRRKSNIRPNRIFTADQRILLYQVGRLRPSKVEEVVETIVNILRQS